MGGNFFLFEGFEFVRRIRSSTHISAANVNCNNCSHNYNYNRKVIFPSFCGLTPPLNPAIIFFMQKSISSQIWLFLRNLPRWFRPGLGIKRWFVYVMIGITLLGLGFAVILIDLYRTESTNPTLLTFLSYASLRFIPRLWRAIIFGGLGIGLVVYGILQLNRSLLRPFIRPGFDLFDQLAGFRRRERGPRVVAIGGGHGLSTLLRGLKAHTGNLTAVVTVADEGGSSGALREELGIPPVGDIRNCIVALADAEPLMRELLQYRFPGGDSPEEGPVRTVPGGLGGHPIGNLLIAALTAIEGGDFEEGVRRMNGVLAVRGQVLPASPTPITLHARTRDGRVVDGQSNVMRTSGIERVWITPGDVAASEDAVAAIAEAELIVLGPGSLYTSLLPVLLIPRIREAVAAARAVRIYVCNVATQAGETAGYDLADHVEALLVHTTPDLVDLVLANDRFDAHVPTSWQAESVRLRWPPRSEPPPRLVTRDVVDAGHAHHHDPEPLAAAILRAAEREAPARRRIGASRTA